MSYYMDILHGHCDNSLHCPTNFEDGLFGFALALACQIDPPRSSSNDGLNVARGPAQFHSLFARQRLCLPQAGGLPGFRRLGRGRHVGGHRRLAQSASRIRRRPSGRLGAVHDDDVWPRVRNGRAGTPGRPRRRRRAGSDRRPLARRRLRPGRPCAQSCRLLPRPSLADRRRRGGRLCADDGRRLALVRQAPRHCGRRRGVGQLHRGRVLASGDECDHARNRLARDLRGDRKYSSGSWPFPAHSCCVGARRHR